MRRKALGRATAVLRLATFGAAMLGLSAAAHAQRLSVVTTTVEQPGDIGRICVVLDSGGQDVAGTQNDLVWDGNCATLADESSCGAVGSHGKQAHFKLQQQDFRIRALLLSLANTKPMGDGPIYCCNVQSEAAPGACCNIGIVNAGASDPKGTAIPTQGIAGKICTAQGGGGRGIGSIDRPQPQGLSNTGPAPDAAAPPAAAEAAPAAGGAAPGPPPAQVLSGGGTTGAVPAGPEPADASQPLGERAVATPATRNVAPPHAADASAPVRPALPPATAVAAAGTPGTPAAGTPGTSAADTPAPVDTATQAAPTAVPTAAAPASTATAAASTPPPIARGWFGCQVGHTTSVWPLLILPSPLLAALWRARRPGSAQR